MKAFALSAIFAAALFSGHPSCLKAEEGGEDFIDQAKWLSSAIVCADEGAPAGVDGKALEEHCRIMKGKAEIYRKNFLDHFIRFMDSVRPGDLPSVVVYPFGGSDLYTAIAAFPSAAEIITISLEGGGDPRRLGKADQGSVRKAMIEFRRLLGEYLEQPDNSNQMARASERGAMPGQILFSLAAASFFGYEPVSVRFFRIGPGGGLAYLNKNEIAGMEWIKGKKLQYNWCDSDYPIAFRNMEIVYRRRGSTMVHRHISANLNDKNFGDSPLKKFLEKKGRVAALTKGASYLMWRKDFSLIRNYLLNNMAFMISDVTGILPHHAAEAGFEQTAYGSFHAPFLDDGGGADTEEFRNFFRSQPFRPISFRYGHADTRGEKHIIVTRPASASKK